MSKLHQAALLVAVATSIACTTDRPPTAPTPIPGPAPASPALRGTVLNFLTQTPVGAGVTVRISSGPPPFLGVSRETVTDANGTYSFPMDAPLSGQYYFSLNDTSVGSGLPRGSEYRGDLMLSPTTCVARYGVVIDVRTFRPIAGATISSSSFDTIPVITQSDGWYLISWGCPDSGRIGFNTTFLYASHPNYTRYEQVIGRGIAGVLRIDFLLEGS